MGKCMLSGQLIKKSLALWCVVLLASYSEWGSSGYTDAFSVILIKNSFKTQLSMRYVAGIIIKINCSKVTDWLLLFWICSFELTRALSSVRIKCSVPELCMDMELFWTNRKKNLVDIAVSRFLLWWTLNVYSVGQDEGGRDQKYSLFGIIKLLDNTVISHIAV